MSERDSIDLMAPLHDNSGVALVARQPLRPVEGVGTPFFPPSYLGSNDKPTYCISELGAGRNLCVVDSVQSQANRLEEAFLHEPYRALVRKIEVTAQLANNESRTLDMLQLGHRLADAAVTFSTLGDEARQALKAWPQAPDAIARLSPMSLLCGLWDSRGEGTQQKIPRAFSATVTARDVQILRRMATFSGSFGSKDLGIAEKLSEQGLDPVPAGEALGGVVAQGPIMRTATLNLVALRANLGWHPGQDLTPVLTYVYALGLLAMSLQPDTFLRQGCLLVNDGPLQVHWVSRNGQERPWALDHDEALLLAQRAAQAFGVPDLPPISATFEKARVKAAKDKAPRGGKAEKAAG